MQTSHIDPDIQRIADNVVDTLCGFMRDAFAIRTEAERRFTAALIHYSGATLQDRLREITNWANAELDAAKARAQKDTGTAQERRCRQCGRLMDLLPEEGADPECGVMQPVPARWSCAVCAVEEPTE